MSIAKIALPLNRLVKERVMKKGEVNYVTMLANSSALRTRL